MSQRILDRPEALSRSGESAASDASCLLKTGCPVQSVDRMPEEGDTGRILIVDDDRGILKLVAKMAERLGYFPTIAAGARDALCCLEKACYELVITDFDMPIMNGFQLADRIKKTYSGTKVVMMTGYYERAAEMMDGSDVVDALLLKPFSLTTMQEKIERVGVALPGSVRISQNRDTFR